MIVRGQTTLTNDTWETTFDIQNVNHTAYMRAASNAIYYLKITVPARRYCVASTHWTSTIVGGNSAGVVAIPCDRYYTQIVLEEFRPYGGPLKWFLSHKRVKTIRIVIINNSYRLKSPAGPSQFMSYFKQAEVKAKKPSSDQVKRVVRDLQPEQVNTVPRQLTDKELEDCLCALHELSKDLPDPE